MTATDGRDIGAILLAGGRGTRVDGAVKPLFEVGGRSLLRAAVDAATAAGASPITVVSAVLDDSLPVTWLREDPPFAGPAAAVVAALDSWPVEHLPGWTLLLACDLPRVDSAVRLLLREAAHARDADGDVDGVCLVDDDGRQQWLIAAYRTAALRAAASVLPERGRDLSIRALLGGLAIQSVIASGDLSHDVDTWEDLHEARLRARRTADIEPPTIQP